MSKDDGQQATLLSGTYIAVDEMGYNQNVIIAAAAEPEEDRQLEYATMINSKCTVLYSQTEKKHCMNFCASKIEALCKYGDKYKSEGRKESEART